MQNIEFLCVPACKLVYDLPKEVVTMQKRECQWNSWCYKYLEIVYEADNTFSFN